MTRAAAPAAPARAARPTLRQFTRSLFGMLPTVLILILVMGGMSRAAGAALVLVPDAPRPSTWPPRDVVQMVK